MGWLARLIGRESHGGSRKRFDRFTPQMRRLLELSVPEARRLGHNYIGTLHLLAALARTPDCAAVAILQAIDVVPDAVYTAAEARAQAMASRPDAPAGLDASARRAIELGVSAARAELGADFFGTQHLLLGIMREAADEATRALAELGVSRDMVLWQARLVRVETSRNG